MKVKRVLEVALREEDLRRDECGAEQQRSDEPSHAAHQWNERHEPDQELRRQHLAERDERADARRRVPDELNPHWTYLADAAGFLRLSTGESTPVPRRQDLPPAYHRDGSVYVTRRDVALERNSMYGDRLVGYVVEDRPWVNIDTPADWARAEELILACAQR